MIRAVTVDINVNLQPLSKLLWQKGIKHRISEESGKQVVWIASEQELGYVQQLQDGLSTGTIELQEFQGAGAGKAYGGTTHNGLGNRVWHLLYRFFSLFTVAPVTLLLMIICGIVALLTKVGSEAYRLGFLFYPMLPYDDLFSLLAGIDSISLFLRTLAPMFLHFGELHIIFNLLWLWFFGRQLETIQSSWLFLLLVVLFSFAGNTAQYLSGHASNFGGMSGVVYGLIGYAWMLHNFVPGKRLMLNNSIFVVFVIALVLMEFAASSMIATAAHLGGLVSGLVAGLLLAAVVRIRKISSR